MKGSTIRWDDGGNVLLDAPTASGFEVGGQNLDEIEYEVEPFCHQAQLALTLQVKGVNGAIVRAYAAAKPCCRKRRIAAFSSKPTRVPLSRITTRV